MALSSVTVFQTASCGWRFSAAAVVCGGFSQQNGLCRAVSL
ncbi:hypothetical protein [Neisseria animaloris]|nr:hypothetical protein [Neisseria animaloris]